MKVLVLSTENRFELFPPHTPATRTAELVFQDRSGTVDQWMAAGGDAQALFATPITPITAEMMDRMPNLRLIQLEGVGYDRVDLEAARRRGIYVCNSAGCNAMAVSELAVTLMSMLSYRVLWGDRMVKEGRQWEAVRQAERQIPKDLSICTVGLVGFGAIAQAAAKKLGTYGSTVYYYARHRRPPEVEEACGATYLPLEELLRASDIVSLHLPATAESRHMADEAFFNAMRPGALLVNTARGAVVDDGALCGAIRSGRLAGAAVDTYDPEPVPPDHPLVALAREFPDRLILCPHYGGIAQSAFRESHRIMFENLDRVMAGQRPGQIVNGL